MHVSKPIRAKYIYASPHYRSGLQRHMKIRPNGPYQGGHLLYCAAMLQVYRDYSTLSYGYLDRLVKGSGLIYIYRDPLVEHYSCYRNTSFARQTPPLLGSKPRNFHSAFDCQDLEILNRV